MTYYSALHYAAKAEAAATTATTLLPYITDISTVAASITNVNTVAGSITGVNSVAADLTNINAVASDLTNIDAVAGDLTNIDAVNTNKTNIDTVAGSIANVNTVAGDITNVNAVAGDLTNINAVAADLTNIDNASTYAAEAKQYAIGEPTEPLGNSAKYWAEQASSELSGLTSRVSSIEGKIPSTATANNQLTDKSYVDTADTALQTQIDALSAASDVSDIVGTYAELQAYDTSTLQNNNIIKVLQDETHNNETTYYRWVITGGVGTWVLIGEEGPYYTIAAADAAFQEKLVSGTNIKTVNGNSLVGSGNVDIDALPNQTGQGGKFLTTNGTTASWAEASVTPDNKSISKNTVNALQSIGIIDQNNPANALKVWHGTQAEYDALATHDANTRYYTDGGLSVSLLDVIYPIGSIYITTNATCPLQTLGVGTWVLESSGIVTAGDIPCKGNGMTLGITNGSTNYGMYMTGGQTQLATGMTGNYGANVGTGGSGTRYTSAKSFGVTLDKTKSGIIADTSSLTLAVNIFRRTV